MPSWRLLARGKCCMWGMWQAATAKAAATTTTTHTGEGQVCLCVCIEWLPRQQWWRRWRWWQLKLSLFIVCATPSQPVPPARTFAICFQFHFVHFRQAEIRVNLPACPKRQRRWRRRPWCASGRGAAWVEQETGDGKTDGRRLGQFVVPEVDASLETSAKCRKHKGTAH